MAIDKPMGYPPNEFKRKWLEAAYREKVEYFDSAKFDDFLRDSKNLNYEEAQKEIKRMPQEKDISVAELIKKGQQYSAQSEVEHYRVIADQARSEGQELYASAMEDMIAKIIASEGKAKAQRKPAEKREPKQKPLVDLTVQTPALTPQTPAPKQEIPLSMQFGEDFDRIREMIREDGAKNLEDAKRLIADRSTRLTDADRFELAELLTIAEQDITPSKEPERIHAPTKTRAKETQRQKFGRLARESRERGLSFEEHIEAMKRGLTKPEEEEGRPEEPEEERNSIRTGKDIFKKEAEEEVPRRPEKVRGISGVKRLKATEAAGTARADTASNAAQKLKSHLSEIILYGLREYIQKNNIDLPVNNLLLTMLAEELIALWFQKVREPTNVREAIGQAIVKREGVMLLASGIEYVKDSNTMREMYEIAKAQNPDMPDFDTAVKGVANAILKIK